MPRQWRSWSSWPRLPVMPPPTGLPSTPCACLSAPTPSACKLCGRGRSPLPQVAAWLQPGLGLLMMHTAHLLSPALPTLRCLPPPAMQLPRPLPRVLLGLCHAGK